MEDLDLNSESKKMRKLDCLNVDCLNLAKVDHRQLIKEWHLEESIRFHSRLEIEQQVELWLRLKLLS